MSFKSLVAHLVSGIVDLPEAVVVREVATEPVLVLELHVDRGDRGKVIGRRGQTARALRTVLAAAAARSNRRVLLNIVDDPE